MRFLVALSLLNSACLVLLLIRLPGEAAQTPAAPEARAVFAPATGIAAGAALPGEARLREIIREELARGAQASAPPQPAASRASDPALRDRIEERIAYYRSVGEISPAELDALNRDMGKLDEATRRELFRELIQAMNRGEIKGLL